MTTQFRIYFYGLRILISTCHTVSDMHGEVKLTALTSMNVIVVVSSLNYIDCH